MMPPASAALRMALGRTVLPTPADRAGTCSGRDGRSGCDQARWRRFRGRPHSRQAPAEGCLHDVRKGSGAAPRYAASQVLPDPYRTIHGGGYRNISVDTANATQAQHLLLAADGRHRWNSPWIHFLASAVHDEGCESTPITPELPLDVTRVAAGARHTPTRPLPALGLC